MAIKNKQAYKQAPWRRQIQMIGLSLIPVVLIAFGIAIYLIISAQAAAAGLEIMDLHFEEEAILRDIANQRSDLAYLTSYARMQIRAKKLGYESPSEGTLRHMTINGYQGQNPVLIAPPPGASQSFSGAVNSAYQQSLSNWVFNTFFSPNYAESSYRE
jgi:hypothetical protein